jgi:flagellar protein FlgJ
MAGIPGIGDVQGSLAIDAQALIALRAQAKTSPDAALGKVASQFEAMFMQMLLKSMRDSLPQDGMLDSEATRTYVGMLDQQLAASLSSKGGIGLADILVKQLRAGGGTGAVDPAAAVSGSAAVNPFNPGEGYVKPGTGVPGKQSAAHVREFIDKVGVYASSASSETGVPARFIAAQAALESNWGRNEIRGADGTQSYNLFGIKAGSGWTGKTVNVVTTEYTNGTAAKTTEKFRAYDSYAEGFLDYAQLLKGRYKAAVAAGDNPQQFAQGLQQGGYATDPRYADKIARIINTNFSARA